jgi:hypothetical protein
MHTYLKELTVVYNSASNQYQLIRKTDNLIIAQGPKSQQLIDLCETLRELQTLMETETPTNTAKLLSDIGKLIDSKSAKQ